MTSNQLAQETGSAPLANSAASPAVYEIDSAHSSAQFSVRHLMISNVRGEFTKVSGTITYDPSNLAASRIDAVIDVATINTREEQRDAHLKGPDFFDAEKFPTLTFKSKSFQPDKGNLRITGDLTMRGVTRDVVLQVDGPTPEVKDPWGNTRVGATATTKVNRKEWGLVWNQVLETGGIAVGDEVSITLDLQAVKKA